MNIEGTESSKVNVNIGVTILGSFIGALGGGNLGVQTGFSRARSVTFKYAAVFEDSIDVLASSASSALAASVHSFRPARWTN